MLTFGRFDYSLRASAGTLLVAWLECTVFGGPLPAPGALLVAWLQYTALGGLLPGPGVLLYA